MQVCQKHWDKLRSALDAKGLSSFVAEDGKGAIEHLVREARGKYTITDFEPLIGSHNILLSAATYYFGPSVMMNNEDGSHRCPVCMLEGIDWIEWVALGARGEAERRGLVGKAGG